MPKIGDVFLGGRRVGEVHERSDWEGAAVGGIVGILVLFAFGVFILA